VLPIAVVHQPEIHAAAVLARGISHDLQRIIGASDRGRRPRLHRLGPRVAIRWSVNRTISTGTTMKKNVVAVCHSKNHTPTRR
jgi:hypothetical protein